MSLVVGLFRSVGFVIAGVVRFQKRRRRTQALTEGDRTSTAVVWACKRAYYPK